MLRTTFKRFPSFLRAISASKAASYDRLEYFDLGEEDYRYLETKEYVTKHAGRFFDLRWNYGYFLFKKWDNGLSVDLDEIIQLSVSLKSDPSNAKSHFFVNVIMLQAQTLYAKAIQSNDRKLLNAAIGLFSEAIEVADQAMLSERLTHARLELCNLYFTAYSLEFRSSVKDMEENILSAAHLLTNLDQSELEDHSPHWAYLQLLKIRFQSVTQGRFESDQFNSLPALIYRIANILRDSFSNLFAARAIKFLADGELPSAQ